MSRLLVALILLSGCGKGQVFDLTAPGGTVDSGTQQSDTGVGPKDGTVDVPDAGEITPDAMPIPDSGPRDVPSPPDATPPPDTGMIMDVGIPDSGLPPDAGGPPDTGLPPDTGIPDAGNPPECLSDSDCGFGGILGRCDPFTLTCVECYQDNHCGGQRVCDTNNGNVCRFPCFNGNCGPIGVCDPSGQFCVECVSATDCDPGEICDTSVYECVECTTNADCALHPGQNICDTSDGECVGCITDSDCPTGEECSPLQGRVCVPQTGRGLCDPCTLDSQCGGTDDLCIGYVGTGGLFDRSCSIDCSGATNACPTGFQCISVRNGEMQCRPRYEMNTPTCTAVRHLGEACQPTPNDLDPGCGIDGVQDARCDPSGMAGICVVWCDDNGDCANGTTCQPSGAGGNQQVCR